MGSFIANGSAVQLELAYLVGLERFHEAGFQLGDPAQYLHPAGHPHILAPDFDNCPGCMPPVHGVVVLLCCQRGGRSKMAPALFQNSGPFAPTAPLEARSGPPQPQAAARQLRRREGLSEGAPRGGLETRRRRRRPPGFLAPLVFWTVVPLCAASLAMAFALIKARQQV